MLARCLPIAALVPPATLSVQVTTQANTQIMEIPTFNYSSISWGHAYRFQYQASPLVLRAVAAAAASNAVLPLTAPSRNSSYCMSFLLYEVSFLISKKL